MFLQTLDSFLKYSDVFHLDFNIWGSKFSYFWQTFSQKFHEIFESKKSEQTYRFWHTFIKKLYAYAKSMPYALCHQNMGTALVNFLWPIVLFLVKLRIYLQPIRNFWAHQQISIVNHRQLRYLITTTRCIVLRVLTVASLIQG